MRNHFSYLLETEDRTFFQKVANEEARVPAHRPVPAAPATMTKTASASSFEKVASRLERDLGILKAAGECGLNAGMQKRADAYVDVLLSHADMTAVEFGEVFDKVAAEAIETDLRAAYHQLCANLPPAEHYIVDEALIKIGHSMVELAMLEKQAFLGALARGLGRLASRAAPALEGAGGAIARGVGGAARGVGRAVAGAAGGVGSAVKGGLRGAGELAATGGKEVGRAVAAPFKAVAGGAKNLAGEFRAGRRAAIMDAPGEVASKLDIARNAATKGGLKGTVGQGFASSLEKELPKAEAKRTALAAREAGTGGRTEVPGMKDIGGKDLGTAPALPKRTGGAGNPTEAVKSKTEAAELGRATGADNAAKAAKPPAAPKAPGGATPGALPKEPSGGAAGAEPKVPKAEATAAEGALKPPTSKEETGGMPTPPGGTEGKPPGFMDAWKKATNGGWKALNAEEKGTLMRGGVTAALVYKGVTGKGAITGGEGII